MNKEILETFIKVSQEFIGNSNSLHKLGTKSKQLENASTKQILDTLNLKDKEVIYTSGECESNNLTIFGLDALHKNKNVIISANEDDTILLPLKHSSFEIRTIDITNNKVDINKLNNLIDNNTILVSISNIENTNEISDFLKDKKCHYHTDISNNYKKINYNNIDLITIEDNSLEGFGCLIKNKNIVLEPIFHGGKSTTTYRSGTPALPFIASFSKLIRLKYKK